MKSVHWILIGALLPIALIVAWSMLDTACTLEAASAANETVRECYRNWIGALSGWAAAIAAGCTIFTILYQIRSSKNIAHKQQIEAKVLFDREVMKLCEEINRVWRDAEDINAQSRDAKHIERQAEYVKRELAHIHRRAGQRVLSNLTGMMHPIEEFRCLRILNAIESASSTVKVIGWDEANQDTERYEPEGFQYIEEMIQQFDFLRYRLEQDEERILVEVFKNRTTLRNQAFENLRELLDDAFTGFLPRNPDNPL
ncbi:hypothetical protein [Labrenzia sp. DG1229]|uniref:hypothetical protein n=1 Tax=Labrenzia sp. DG1229 TaxID=681847 RepID=UPI0012EC1382|nr:hypothetical protein [Labrenzia sp. DG1229]